MEVEEEPTSPISASSHPAPAAYMSRLRMGRKCLESLMAKMMLGMRKKVQQPKLNQKAFCKERTRGSPLSCVRRGSPWGLGSLEVAGCGVSGLLMVLVALNLHCLVLGCFVLVPCKQTRTASLPRDR